MKTFLTACAAAAALITGTAASAREETSRSISLSGRDLLSNADVQQVTRRIERAARLVCGPLTSRTLAEYNAVSACRARAAERAMRDLGERVADARRGDGSRVAAVKRGVDPG